MAETRISSEIVERLHRLRLGDDDHSGVMAVLRDVGEGFPQSTESERGENLRRAVARVFKTGERLGMGGELVDIVHQHHGDLVAELEIRRAGWRGAKAVGPRGPRRPRARGERNGSPEPVERAADAPAQSKPPERPEMAASSMSRDGDAAEKSEPPMSSFDVQRNSEEFQRSAFKKKAPPCTPPKENNPPPPGASVGNSRSGASAPPGAAPRAPIAIDDGWRPDPKSMALAVERLGRDAAERQLERFVNHQLAKGLRSADFNAAFRNWIDGEVEHLKRFPKPPPDQPNTADVVRRTGAKRLSGIAELRHMRENPPASETHAA